MSVILSAAQAAKRVGKSVPTITRAIKSGRLSADKLDGGGYAIDPSELFRVFDPVSSTVDKTPSMLRNETPQNNNALDVEVKMLREQIARMDGERDRERQQLTDQIDNLRTQLQNQTDVHKTALAALTDQREQSKKRRFFGLLAGEWLSPSSSACISSW